MSAKRAHDTPNRFEPNVDRRSASVEDGTRSRGKRRTGTWAELEAAPDGTAHRARIRPTSRQTSEAGKEPSPGGKAARPALVAGTGGTEGIA